MKFLHFKHDLYRTLKAKFTILTILKSTLGEIQHIYVVGLSTTTSLISDFFFFFGVRVGGGGTPGNAKYLLLALCEIITSGGAQGA